MSRHYLATFSPSSRILAFEPSHDNISFIFRVRSSPKSDAYTVLQVGGRIRDGEEDGPLKLFTGDYVFCKLSKTDYQNTFRKKIFDAKNRPA